MFNPLVQLAKKQSHLVKSLLGLAVSVAGFTVYDSGRLWGLILPLTIALYIILSTLVDEFKKKG